MDNLIMLLEVVVVINRKDLEGKMLLVKTNLKVQIVNRNK